MKTDLKLELSHPGPAHRLSGALALFLVVTGVLVQSAVAQVDQPCETSTRHAELVSEGVVYWVGDGIADLPDDDFEAALVDSIDAWNSVTCSTASLSYGGRVDRVEDVEEGIPILFADPAEERCFPPGLIGFTVFACADLVTPTVFLNRVDFEWSASPAPYRSSEPLLVDATSVVTHELGHVLGIDHLPHPLATMSASYLKDGGQRTLAAEDKHALCTITGGGEDECANDSDCSDFGRCSSSDLSDFKVCNEERGAFGDYCSLSFQICDQACVVTDSTQGTGFCSKPCGMNSECPQDYECSGSTCRLTPIPKSSGCSSIGVEASGSPQWPGLLLILSTLGCLAFRRSRCRETLGCPR